MKLTIPLLFIAGASAKTLTNLKDLSQPDVPAAPENLPMAATTDLPDQIYAKKMDPSDLEDSSDSRYIGDVLHELAIEIFDIINNPLDLKIPVGKDITQVVTPCFAISGKDKYWFEDRPECAKMKKGRGHNYK